MYISGKISGLPVEQAKAKFGSYAQVLAGTGAVPVNPFDNGLPEDASWQQHMRADIAMMMTCDEVHMLPCWIHSQGATVEFQLAKQLGMHIVLVEPK